MSKSKDPKFNKNKPCIPMPPKNNSLLSTHDQSLIHEQHKK